jgi:PAS domain S-box-containing protein
VNDPLPEPPAAFPDAVVIVNSRGRIIQANAAAASLFGFEEHEINGMSVRALFPGQSLIFPGGRSGQGGQAGRYLELAGRRRDSSQFPAVVSVMPVRIGNGTVAIMNIRDSAESERVQSVLSRGLEILMSEDMYRQALLRHLVRAREEERARIAAGIHDDAIQMLSAASLRLQQLRLRLHDPAARQVLEKLQDALSLSLSHLRQVIYDLRPPGLEDGSLGAALRVYLEQMHSETGIAYRLDDQISARAPESTALLIYRTVREALANVRQHARASTVTVELSDVEDGCLVRIVDDGVGYDPADIEDRPGHLGLALIRERAELAGGWCRIESSPGSGTTVEFWVPFGESSTEPGPGHELAG